MKKPDLLIHLKKTLQYANDAQAMCSSARNSPLHYVNTVQERLKAVIADLERTPDPVLLVQMEGGVVQSVYSAVPASVIIFDEDHLHEEELLEPEAISALLVDLVGQHKLEHDLPFQKLDHPKPTTEPDHANAQK